MRVPITLLLILAWTGVPVLGEGFTMSAPELADYCFYAVYESLSSYAYLGATTTSSGSGSTNSTSSDSSSSSSTVVSILHGSSKRGFAKRIAKMAKRGHHGSSSTGGCTSPVGVMSLYASAKSWCNQKQLEAAIPYWQTLCEQNSVSLISMTDIIANTTDSYIASLPIIDPETNSTTTTGTIESPVLLSHSYYKRAYKSYVTHDYAHSKDIRYGWGLMGYWAGILVLGMIVKAWKTMRAQLYTRKSGVSEKSGFYAAGRSSCAPVPAVTHFLRTYLVIPASFAPGLTNHQQLKWFHTIPKRLDLLIVFGWWAVCVILSCVDYQSFKGNIQTPSLSQQNWQYLSGRTGILSYACLPFLWLFGGRNNIFLWATDFNVQSFNIFHRHVARACTILAVVHSINYTVVFQVYEGRYHTALKQNYFYMGVVATVVMCVMLFQSGTWLRRRFYETFLIIHVLLAILTIYALFRHTSLNGTAHNFYLWPMVAIWGFDRAVRYLRVIYCNWSVWAGKGFVKTTSSTVTYSPASDLIRIEMTPAAKGLTPASGQHYYLYQPSTLRGWENHPFTLGCYNLSGPEPKLTFYIRPYDGWTRRLRDRCRWADTGALAITPRLLLEGPYGHQAPLHTFDTLLLIVGGTGIAAAVPYILDHVSRLAAPAKTRTTRIHLVWSSRQRQMFDEICCTDLATALECPDIQTTLYCTDKRSMGATTTVVADEEFASSAAPPIQAVDTESKEVGPVMQDSSSQESQPIKVEHLGLELFYGRPDIPATVQATAEEARASVSRLAVLMCGPAEMADACRMAVYWVMKGGFRDVEYFEEAFGW
ncbi:ferric reductase family protein [Aspergillus saccharolyticus JOP 1030-1]|uniref:Ferric reductase transmembrane component 4 n=1 Tax=Aspergillus saccharolyticus JOP 1030-1 TaxID=1450539 RepID=A0A318ZNH2_9EURO|nr:ferric reductase transmembrane component 4 precursor [Aspergillus saccharolyticus JOP 1030-1]PYH48527.1 ferric reductase transmembrane component 4 precursor [Aspergillus saccharolyticus JOP 1030-1]